MSTLNTSDFESALKFVMQATGKEGPPLLNKYALQTIIGSKGIEGAMQRTPKADRAKIQAVSDATIRASVVAKLRKAGKLKSTTTAQILAYVAFEKQRRLRAKGYTAYVGWTPAAKVFGGTGAVGSGKTPPDARRFAQSEAAHGGGTKATDGNAVASLFNTAPMAEILGFDALQASLDAQAEDMTEHATLNYLQPIFNKVAGKYV